MAMKKITFLFSLLVFTTVLNAQNLKALDEKYGFREAIFETPIDSFKNFKEVQTNFYSSTSENLSIGDYSFDKVYYAFYKKQLYSVIIKTKGYSNSRGFLSILQKAYGNGSQSNEYIEKYYWFGELVTLSYNQNSITDDATIYFSCKKLSNLKQAEKKKADAEASEQL